MSERHEFNPADYGKDWTQDSGGGYYRWDRERAHKEARAARDEKFRILTLQGFDAHKSSEKQWVSQGIGEVTVYLVTVA